MPAAYWAAFHWAIGSVGFNNAQQCDLGNECIEMAEAQAALESFAYDLQGSDVFLLQEEFYPKAFGKRMDRPLDIARYELKHAWGSTHQGLHRLRKFHANKQARETDLVRRAQAPHPSGG